MVREETSARSWKAFFPRQVRDLPADLAFVLFLVVLTDLSVFLPVVSETPLRIVVGLPFVLFLPGYVLVAALFPEAGTPPAVAGEEANPDSARDEDRTGIDDIERIALSLGLSIAVVPLIGLVLNFTPWGIREGPIVASLTVFVVTTTAVAARRRHELSAVEQFTVDYRAWFASTHRELFEPDNRADAALNVLFVCSVLLTAGSVGYAVGFSGPGEAFTEFYLVTEGDDGELVADRYPRNFTVGESKSVMVGVSNHEHRSTTYSIVVELQQVRSRGNVTTVQSESELGRLETPTIADNETWHRQYRITPETTGTRLRLAFLLYDGSVPSNPTVENAYRETHLWVNVSGPS